MDNVSEPIRFGWLLWSDSHKASTRINGLNIHHELRRKGYESFVLPNPYTLKQSTEILFSTIANHRISIVVLHKYLYKTAGALIRFCHNRGIATVYLACDPVEWSDAIGGVDGIIAVTQILLNKIPFPGTIPTIVLPDAHETPPDLAKFDYRNLHKKLLLGTTSTRRLHHIPFTLRKDERIEIIGSRTILDLSTIFGIGLFSLLYKMKYGAKHATVPFPVTRQWHIETFLREMLDFDIGILPESDESFLYKSNNRLTQMMSLGLPVIASPLPAYRSIITHGKNGFLADNPSDWRMALEALKDPDTRRQIGQKARKDTFDTYSIQTISLKFIKFCERLVNKRPSSENS